MIELPEALKPLEEYPQFLAYRLVPNERTGKMDKKPISTYTGKTADPTDPRNHDLFREAKAFVEYGRADGVGFALTENDGLWFIDIDNCLQNGQWSPLAQSLMNSLAGAAVEVSQSGKGLHIIGTGRVPPHKCKNVALGLELYTEGRFIALTGNQTTGSVTHDCTAAMQDFVQKYFPPDGPGTDSSEWTDGPVTEWDGHTGDAELVEHAKASGNKAAGAFSASRGASFSDLWERNTDVLASAYPSQTGNDFDESSADLALAQHLAFWTGKDCERTYRLMWLSALVRDKWEAREDYLRETVQKACGQQREVHQRKRKPATGDTAPLGLPFEVSAETGALLSARRERLIRFNGAWFTRESGGYYRDIDEELIRKEIRTRCGWQLKPTGVNAAIDELKSAVVVDAHGVTVPHWLEDRTELPPAAELIVARNGILDPATRRLYDHSEALLTFNALPFDYEPDSPPPERWLRFLSEVFQADQESINELQKLAGYLLTLDTSQQKIFALIGPKRSGKGTIARVFRALIGEQNVTSPSFTSVGRPFGLESLIGKQLAIFPDARIGRTTDKAVVSERLLSISGEDALDIERKHRGDWHGKIGARLLILSNEVPVLGDASGALASRYVVFHTPTSFYGKEDRDLTDKLVAELPGILNWSLDGLQRLKAEGRINTPAAARELVEEIDALGSPIKAFVRDCCTIGDGLNVGKDELWNAYRQWHIENGLSGSAFSKEIFSRNLKTAFAGQFSEYRPTGPGSRPRRWTGIRLYDAAPVSVTVSAAARP